jgi:hypothetical protein
MTNDGLVVSRSNHNNFLFVIHDPSSIIYIVDKVFSIFSNPFFMFSTELA